MLGSAKILDVFLYRIARSPTHLNALQELQKTAQAGDPLED
jgi:hypothetical protein